MKNIRFTVFSKIITGVALITFSILLGFGTIIYSRMAKIDKEAFENSFLNIASEVDVAIENYF